ncbi:hypothetical protein BLX88_23865, partial [Bacillus obstructivus]
GGKRTKPFFRIILWGFFLFIFKGNFQVGNWGVEREMGFYFVGLLGRSGKGRTRGGAGHLKKKKIKQTRTKDTLRKKKVSENDPEYMQTGEKNDGINTKGSKQRSDIQLEQDKVESHEITRTLT